MLNFKPDALSERDNYKLLIGSIIPRPIALISTLNEDESVNVAPFSYFNIISSNPPILGVSIQRLSGVKKDTARNIEYNKEAVIHIVDVENVEDTNQTAANLEAGMSELKQTEFKLTNSHFVKTPAISNSKVRFEVTLREHIEIRHEGRITTDLLLLDVQHYVIAEEIYKDGKIDPRLLNAMSRLAGHDYGTIGEILTIERPK